MRLALKVVTQNGGYFVDVIPLTFRAIYLLLYTSSWSDG